MGSLKYLLATSVGLASLCAAPAFAQTESADDGYGAEIIVTAQKREENLQDVPVAVSVASGEALDALNITSVEQLKLLVPSFEATPFGISIRGVGTSTFSTSIEPTVSTVVDGVVLGRPEMALGSFYDIERVEILRGPQGMLFGKNASSGLVNITTRAPQLGAFEARGDISYGEGDYRRGNLTLNIPIGENFALRGGVYGNYVEGILENAPDGRRFNGNDEWGGRLRGLWRVSPDLDVLVTGDYLRQDAPYVWASYETNPAGLMALANSLCGVTASHNNLETCINGPADRDLETYGLTTEVNWDLGGLTLTSITNGRREFLFNSTDSDSTTANVLDTNINEQDIQQYSQEFRITSPSGERLEYVAGLYYFNLRTQQQTVQTGTFGLLPFPVGNSTIDSLVRAESTAVFGQAAFHVTDDLTFIAGGRVTHDEISLDFHQRAQPGFVAIQPVVGPTTDSTEETNFSWRLGAQYDVTPDVMTYFTVSRGYKGPGFNQTAVSNPTQDQVVGPEIPTSYELGLKTSFFEGAITANFAVFHTEFEDYQAQVVDFDVTPAAFRTVNAGSLESQGFEADITAILPPGILLSAAVTYLDANYGEFAPISCYTGQTPAQGCDILVDPGFPPFLPPTYAYDPSGQPLAGVAEWKTSFGAYYERELSAELNGFVQADYSWRSDVNASSAGDPRTRIDAYGLLGASIGVKAEDDSWRFSIWGRNLTDERFPSSLFNTVFGGAGDYSYVPTADAVQRVGVSLSFRH